MKQRLLTLMPFLAYGLAAAPAAGQEDIASIAADDTERRCCIVDKGRWVREPQSLWTQAACVALGEDGEYAPQGTPGAGACAANEPDYDDPSPIPPDPMDKDDNGGPGGVPGNGDADGKDEDKTAGSGCPDSWGEPRVWSPSAARAHAVAYVLACDRLIKRALTAGDWATLETLRENLSLWGLESVELSDPLVDAMSGGTPPANIGEIATQAHADINILSGAQRGAAVLENFIEAAQIAAPRTAGAVSACTGDGFWRFESEGDNSLYVRAADAAYAGTLWRNEGTKDTIPVRRAVDTWLSFTVPQDPGACPEDGAVDAVR